MTTPKRVLVVLSGGQDSTTCLFWALKQGFEVHAVTFDYGQKHRTEIDSAYQIGVRAGLSNEQHEFICVGSILRGTSPLVNPGQELEQYEGPDALPGGLEKTFVPMRNQFFLTVAANIAYAKGITTLITGVCQEDSGGYPDCTAKFIHALEHACNVGTFTGQEGALGNLEILTPLMNMTKAASVDMALGLAGCYKALSLSHTSYDGQFPPTGKDHATLLREKGFRDAGVPDPLWLRALEEKKIGLRDLPKTDNYSMTKVGIYYKMLGYDETVLVEETPAAE